MATILRSVPFAHVSPAQPGDRTFRAATRSITPRASFVTLILIGSSAGAGTCLAFQGDTITALIDGTSVATVTDSTYHGGQVGLQVGGYYAAQFDNLTVTRGGQ